MADVARLGQDRAMAASTIREDVRAGARAVAPMLVGVVPFGLVAGATPVTHGLGRAVAVGFAAVVGGTAAVVGAEAGAGNLSLMVGAVSGIVAGTLAELRWPPATPSVVPEPSG